MKKLLAILIVPLPSLIKIAILRHLLKIDIGQGVRIGLSYIAPSSGKIGNQVKIGHLNIITRMQNILIGNNAIIGHANIILGGREVIIGEGVVIGRFNEINSILSPLTHGRPNPVLLLGRHSIITSWHKIDFTDQVEFGESVVFAGRLSNIWTHNRQDVGPVSIGKASYIGSGVQMTPRSAIGEHCVVGLGAVITKKFIETEVLIAGIPAKVVKPLDESSMELVNYPSRPDIYLQSNFTKD